MSLLGCGTGCDDMASNEPVRTGPEERVADSSAITEGARLHLKVQNRYVTLIRLQGQLHCIDSVCFHAGGPLGVGDIEDVNGRQCLVCPWHYYKIDIETGDKYYQQMSFENGKMVQGEWASNGVRQRTHSVREADGGVYVALSLYPLKRDSDEYAYQEACGERVMGTRGGQQGLNVGGDGRKPSGAVLRSAREAAKGVGRPGFMPP